MFYVDEPKYTNSEEYDAYCEKLISNIIPTAEPNLLSMEELSELLPEKIEYWDGFLQGDTETTMERFVVLCLYNFGFKRILDRLPEFSKN